MMDPTPVPSSPTTAPAPVVAPSIPLPELAMGEAEARARRLVARQLAMFTQHDIDAVAATFSADARIYTGHRGPPVETEQGVRIFVTSLYSQFPGLALELTSCRCQQDPAERALDGAAPVTCEVRWLAHWHEPDSGRLMQQTRCGRYRILGERVSELRLQIKSFGE